MATEKMETGGNGKEETEQQHQLPKRVQVRTMSLLCSLFLLVATLGHRKSRSEARATKS